jgi:hypothetical protein
MGWRLLVARTHAKIVADIRSFAPVDGDWRRLDALLDELWRLGSPAEAVPELLGVFERFPEDDGAGVFWAILHGLESLPGYADEVVRSVQKRPSSFGVLMLNRILNGGRSEVGGVQLIPLLRQIAQRLELPEMIQRDAREFAELHGG